jgi:hypothetical protein
MTGAEHFLAAERWLFKAAHPDAQGSEETPESCAGVAQVHATLSVAASLAELAAAPEPRIVGPELC